MYGGCFWLCREARQREERGEVELEPPDYNVLIPKRPHWCVVRVDRNAKLLKHVLYEALALHEVLAVMELKPSGLTEQLGLPPRLPIGGRRSPSREVDDGDELSGSGSRHVVLEACINSITTGLVV